MKELKEYMNDSAYCSHCRKETKTNKWDCVECGFSKGHPDAWLHERDMDKKGQTGSTITQEDLQVTDATIERIRRGGSIWPIKL